MKKLFIMVGAPGSGKSTFLKNNEKNFNPSHIIISRDEIRFSLLKEGEAYFSKENEVYKEFIKQIKMGLKNFEEVYVDATHLNKASRMKLFYALGDVIRNVELYAIVIKVPLEQAIAQNQKRYGTKTFVPEEALRNMYKNFTLPALNEGFKEIWIYISQGIGKPYHFQAIKKFN